MPKTVKGITIPDTVYLDAQRATAPLAIMSVTDKEIDLLHFDEPIIVNVMRWPLPDPQQAMVLKGKVEMKDKKFALGTVTSSDPRQIRIILEDAGTLVVGSADVFVWDEIAGVEKSNRLAVTIVDTTP
jgi:hypothetical protein